MVSQRLLRTTLLRYGTVLCITLGIWALILIGNHLFEKLVGRVLY